MAAGGMPVGGRAFGGSGRSGSGGIMRSVYLVPGHLGEWVAASRSRPITVMDTLTARQSGMSFIKSRCGRPVSMGYSFIHKTCG
jgi:hypothetical protein